MNEDKKKKRKELILAESKKMIRNNGFQKAAMSKIAQKCNLAVGTLYNYFKSKNDILLAIFEIEIDKILESGNEIVHKEINNVIDHIMNLLHNYTAIFDLYDKDFWINFMAEAQIKVDISKVSGALWLSFERVKHQIEEVLCTMIDKGALRKDVSTSNLSRLLFYIYYIHFREYIYSDFSISQIIENIRQEVEIIYHGIKSY